MYYKQIPFLGWYISIILKMVSELPHTIDVIVTLQVQNFRGIGDNCRSSSLMWITTLVSIT